MSVTPGLIALVVGDVLLDYNEPRPKDVLRDRHGPSPGWGERSRGTGRFAGGVTG